MRWLVRCFQIAGDDAVFHGFGLTSWRVMGAFPWYSVDSSSWGGGFRFGRVPVFDAKRGRFLQLNLGDAKAWHKHRGLVEALGFDPLDFADRSRNDRAKICAISALSYMLAERWLRKHHGSITIPQRDPKPDDAGPKLHIVDGSITNLSDGQQGLKLYLVETVEGMRDIRTVAKEALSHD